MPLSSIISGAIAPLLISAPSGAKFPVGKVKVLFMLALFAASGDSITLSGCASGLNVWRLNRTCLRLFLLFSASQAYILPPCSQTSKFSPNVLPVTVRQSSFSRPNFRKCNITSGTPPAAYTCAVEYFPAGSTLTNRGVCRLIFSHSSRVGIFNPAAWAIAGI